MFSRKNHEHCGLPAKLGRRSGNGRVGFMRHGRRLLLTDRLAYAPTPSPIIDDYNGLAECAGCPPPGHRMELFTTDSDERAADAVWARFRLADRPEVICLNPGAAF